MALEPLAAAALVRRCLRELPDDTRAFEELVAAYQGRVFTIAYRMLGDRHEAEDLAQDVFLKVFRSLKNLDEPQTLTSWISRITTNAALDVIDARKRRPRMAPLTPVNDDGDEEPRYADLRTLSPEDQAVLQEERRCLEQTLASMEPQARATLILRELEEWSYSEIAKHLTIGLSAVKMRIHRARLHFQQLLERICPDLGRRKVELS